MKRSECIKHLKRLSKHYGVSFRLVKNANNMSGQVDVARGMIEIVSNESVHVILSTFFHEVGHIHCYRNGIWKVFHEDVPPRGRKVQVFKATAYKAELWVENWGEKEMKKHFPKIKYYRNYGIDPVWEKKWLREYYSDIFNK